MNALEGGHTQTYWHCGQKQFHVSVEVLSFSYIYIQVTTHTNQ